jgi:hypothetical protein
MNLAPPPPKAELSWWYKFYFATERGRAGYETYRHDFVGLIWQTVSPKWSLTTPPSTATRLRTDTGRYAEA